MIECVCMYGNKDAFIVYSNAAALPMYRLLMYRSSTQRTTAQVEIKGSCSDPQPHSPTFFKHMEILVQEVDSYLEGFVCEIL